MKKTNLSLCFSRRLVSALALTLLLSQGAQAQVDGTIFTIDGKSITGSIRWMAAAKKYVVTTVRAGGGQFEVELQPAQVDRVAVPQPKELAPAIQAARSGNIAAAIPVLTKIVRDYQMLQWDEPAARALAEAQLANNNPAEAVKACEVVTALKPEAAFKGDLAVVYWQALLKSNRSAKLRELLEEAIKKGGPVAAANALILRGDMLMEQKLPRDALKDGYLRVVVLCANVRSAQPEALFKAAKAFEALNQNPNAERMRSALRSQYPSSDFAKKL
jgi:TolA-binding protein